MSELKPGSRAYSFVGINDYVEIKTGKMSELKLSEYLINRFAIFNKDKPLKSEAKLVQMAEALEKRVKESKWDKALDAVKPLIDGLTVIGWDQKEVDKFWEEFNKLRKNE